MGTSINTNQLRKTIVSELLDNKLEFLETELTLLLKHKKYNFCENYDDFKAISFEYDYPFDFCFVGYPSPELFDNWSETAIIQLPNNHTRSISDILNEFYKTEKITQEEFDDEYWPLAKSIYRNFFSKCWKNAKKAANSNKRAFLFEHDISVGWDCDMNKDINENNLKTELERENGI